MAVIVSHCNKLNKYIQFRADGYLEVLILNSLFGKIIQVDFVQSLAKESNENLIQLIKSGTKMFYIARVSLIPFGLLFQETPPIRFIFNEIGDPAKSLQKKQDIQKSGLKVESIDL